MLEIPFSNPGIRHVSSLVVIDIRRWDPFTALLAAFIATIAHTTDAAAGVFKEPYKVYKERHDNQPTDPSKHSEESDHQIKEGDDASVLLRDSTGHKQTTSLAMVTASATSAGRILTKYAKGILVDMPLAATEGMRAVPRLYNEDTKPHSKITGFRSGMSVAGEVFRQDTYEAITDIFVYTYKGKKMEGPKGVVAGLGKGLTSMTAKTASATVGLFAYPAQGLYRSVHNSIHNKTRKKIEKAKELEGEWLLNNLDPAEDLTYVDADFQTLCS